MSRTPLPSASTLKIFGVIRRRLNIAVTQMLKPLGIGPKQAVILRYIAENPECSLASAARATATDPAALGRAIDALIRSGWVVRHPHSTDKRKSGLSLTRSGAVKTRRVQKIYQSVAAHFVSALTPAERRAFDHCLSKINASLGERQKRKS
jgi:DNA-binding MarR family transcriptional regulator